MYSSMCIKCPKYLRAKKGRGNFFFDADQNTFKVFYSFLRGEVKYLYFVFTKKDKNLIKKIWAFLNMKYNYSRVVWEYISLGIKHEIYGLYFFLHILHNKYELHGTHFALFDKGKM